MSYIYTTEVDKAVWSMVGNEISIITERQLIHYELPRLPLEIIRMILIKFKGLTTPHCRAINITKKILPLPYKVDEGNYFPRGFDIDIPHLSEDEISELRINPFKGMGDIDRHMELRGDAHPFSWHERKWSYQCRWQDGLWGNWSKYKGEEDGKSEAWSQGGFFTINKARLNPIVSVLRSKDLTREDMRDILDDNEVEWKKSWNKKRVIKAMMSY